MKDKHGDEVKLGDKVIGIDLDYNPPLHIGKITDMSDNIVNIIELGENILDDDDHPRFFSEEFELWTPERELITKLEI
jgi:hypothetical protein